MKRLRDGKVSLTPKGDHEIFVNDHFEKMEIKLKQYFDVLKLDCLDEELRAALIKNITKILEFEQEYLQYYHEQNIKTLKSFNVSNYFIKMK